MSAPVVSSVSPTRRWKRSLPRPFLKWVGGKRQLLPPILAAIRCAGPFRTYHEPFLGGGAVFFALSERKQLPERALLSDVNANLVNAYLGVRSALEELLDELATHEVRHDEAYFYAVRAEIPATLAAQAARIIYLNKTCFNGLYRENKRGLFNTPFGRYKNPSIRDEANLRAVCRALQDVVLEAQGFEAALGNVDPGDLVYADPPYIPLSKTSYFTAYSKDDFGYQDQVALASALRRLADRGVKVIASNSYTEATLSLYEGFHIQQVQAARSVNSRTSGRGKVAEALITSFEVVEGA